MNNEPKTPLMSKAATDIRIFVTEYAKSYFNLPSPEFEVVVAHIAPVLAQLSATARHLEQRVKGVTHAESGHTTGRSHTQKRKTPSAVRDSTRATKKIEADRTRLTQGELMDEPRALEDVDKLSQVESQEQQLSIPRLPTGHIPTPEERRIRQDKQTQKHKNVNRPKI